jgi:hypothetical protein
VKSICSGNPTSAIPAALASNRILVAECYDSILRFNALEGINKQLKIIFFSSKLKIIKQI